MRTYATTFGLMLVITVLISAAACADTLVAAPDAAVYIAPTAYDGRFSARMGDTSVASPGWHIVQWNNPEPLTASQAYAASPGRDWAFSTSTARVQYYVKPRPGSGLQDHTFELAQQGAIAQFPLPCGAEYDLAFETNGTNYKDASGAKTASVFKRSRPIGTLSHASFNISLGIPREDRAGRCSQAFAAYAVTLYLTSSKGGGMFFQVFLRDSRGIVQNNTPCGGYPNGKTYCFSSTIDQVGVGQRQQGAPSPMTAYSFDVLRSMRQAIAHTYDPNPLDWTITAATFGGSINGGMATVSRWANFSVSTD